MRGRGELAIGGVRGTSARLVLGAVAVIALIAAGGAAAATHGSARERRATHAYLLARYNFERLVVQNIPASEAAFSALLAGIARECPQALAAAPVPAVEPKTAAEAAAVALERQQLGALIDEIVIGGLETWLAPDLPAVRSLSAKIRSLRFGERRLQRAAALSGVDPFVGRPPDICADVRFWAQSGYHTISPATQAYAAREQTAVSEVADGRQSLDELIRPFEGAPERRLLARYRTLSAKLNTALTRADVIGHLRTALALQEPPEQIGANGGAPDSVPIGTGRTDAGTSFIARAQLPSASEHASCAPKISIEEPLAGGGEANHSASDCGPDAGRRPAVACEEGQLRVQAVLPVGVRSATLTLSDGRQITSPVFEVPAAAGGPAGFYYQAVRGPAPIPVSLTELSEAGATLAVVKLEPVVECTRHPHKTLSGRRTLARGRTPGGQAYSIFGERFREFGRIHVVLGLEVGASGTSSTEPSKPPRALSWELASGCKGTHRYWILLGVLRSASQHAYVRSGSQLTALTAIALPASLHTHGAIVYGAFASPPAAIVLRDASGRTIGSASPSPTHGAPRARRCAKLRPDTSEGLEVGSGTILGSRR